jgi:hypothetical protein
MWDGVREPDTTVLSLNIRQLNRRLL